MAKPSRLSTTILKSVSVRVLVVIIISSALSYFHLYNTIESGIKDTLQKYVGERVKREEELFLLAQKNHEILKLELSTRLKNKVTQAEIQKFDQLLHKWPDGTTRNRKELYDGTKSAGVFIPPNVIITDDLKHRIVIMIDLVESYGKAFRSRFQDTYFTTSENIMVLYWPEVPNWTMQMKSDFNMLAEEYVWVADKKHNPERASVWTGAFYDKVGKTWMTSIETPLDGKDWSITIGHDVMLDEFVGRVSDEHLKGTYNIIFRKDGRLITHPALISDIEKNEGKLDLQKTDDLFLKEIFNTVVTTKIPKATPPIIKPHPESRDLLAFSKIGGPGWFFVTVFPDSLITSTALSGIIFIIALALASLAFEITFLYFGLKRDVIEPLRTLEESVKRISQGEYLARVELNRTDELGQLAESFNLMGQKIYDHEKHLIEKVEERTKQLDEQRAILVQKSKLASLGEMAGGIAHEINTPLAIIGMRVEQLSDSIEENDINPQDFKKSLGIIKKTTDRIAKIVSGLRFVARDGSGLPMEKANINTIVDETLSFCSEQMRLHSVNIEVLKNYTGDLLINCRSVEISQVLLNLLNNAKDAVAHEKEKWIQIHIADKDNEIEISVMDSGPGIPKEIQEKIMQPFFTTKEVGKGTGLGLSISHGIIKSHKGSFYLVDSPHTKFVIVLPKS